MRSGRCFVLLLIPPSLPPTHPPALYSPSNPRLEQKPICHTIMQHNWGCCSQPGWLSKRYSRLWNPRRAMMCRRSWSSRSSEGRFLHKGKLQTRVQGFAPTVGWVLGFADRMENRLKAVGWSQKAQYPLDQNVCASLHVRHRPGDCS